jgi:hypothetical protein
MINTHALYMDTQKHCLSHYQMKEQYSMHIHAFEEMSGMIGQWYILKRKIILDS